MDTDNSHTNPTEGHSDNVFFTYGPGKDLETVRFMDYASNVITVHPEVLSKNTPKTWRGIPKPLHGMWGSDHFYAYNTEQESISITLGDCRYSVFYRNIKDGETGVHLVKFCQYDRADRTSATQMIEKGGEVFTYPRINQGILLSVIEKVRLMGCKTWGLVMNQMSIEEQEKLVQTLYHTGVFEVHKPRSFLLNQPGVEIITRESKNDAEKASSAAFSQSLIDAAYTGSTKEVLEFCKSNEDFSKISGKLCNDVFNVNLLGAAILGGHVTLVKALLDLGADIVTDRNITMKCKDGVLVTFSVSPLILVFCLTNPNDDWQITPNKAAAGEIMRLLIEVGTADRKNFCIRHPLSVTVEEIETGLSGLLADPDHIVYLLNTLGTQLNVAKFRLELAVNTRSVALVQKMLDLNTDVASWFSQSSYKKLSSLESGVTPLLVAAAHGDESMAQLILSRKAPIDQEFCAIRTREDAGTLCLPLHEFEGYTPLLMAVEKRHLPLVKLLVERGANLFHRSAVGKTAISIAIKKGNASILSFLQAAMAAKVEVKEAVNLQMVEYARIESAKIQQHYTRIILTGKEAEAERFFLVYAGGEKEVAFSPFMASIPTRKFNNGSSKESAYKKIMTDLNHLMHLELQLANVRWGSIAELSCYIPGDETHYADNIIFCELENPKGIKERIASSQYNYVKCLTASDFVRDSSGKCPCNQEHFLPKITYALLACINRVLSSSDMHLSKEEHDALNRGYQETLIKQHQLLQAAKTGNIQQLEALLHQGAVLWHEIPTLEAFAKPNQQDFRWVPFQMALENNQLGCALYILKSVPNIGASRFCQFIDCEMLRKIVQTGHVELYRVIHENNSMLTDVSMLREAIAGGHMPLASYIGDCISPNSGTALVAMAEAAKSGNFDEAARLLNELPETLLQLQCLDAIFGWNVINKAISAGHLAFYKALHEKKYRGTDVFSDSVQIFCWLAQANAGGHKSLVRYIADCISLNSGDAFVEMAEAAKLGNFDEAARLLNELPAPLLQPQCLNAIFDRGVVEKAVCAGHLEFYKALHEKIPQNHYSFLLTAVAGRHALLARYIVDGVSPNSGADFFAMTEAVKLGNFNEASRLLNELPNTLINPYLDAIFDRDVIQQAVCAGHLELYKTLHEKKHKYTDFSVNYYWSVYYFLCAAIRGGYMPLAHYIAESINPGSGIVLVAMLEAVKAGNFDEVLRLLSSLPETLVQPQCLNAIFDRDVIQKAVCVGHLDFYKMLYEKKHQYTNFSVNSWSVYYFLNTAITDSNTSLAYYISESVRPGNGYTFLEIAEAAQSANRGDTFLKMLEAVQSGNFGEAFRLLDRLPNIFMQPKYLNAIFGWDEIHKMACVGHLTLYKALHESKHWFADNVGYVCSVLSYAITNGNEPLALYILQARSEKKDKLLLMQCAQSKGLANVLSRLSQMPMQPQSVLESPQRAFVPAFEAKVIKESNSAKRDEVSVVAPAVAEMAEAAKLGDFDKVLRLLNELPEALIQPKHLNLIFSWDVIKKAVCEGRLDFYKTLHEKKHQRTDFSIDSSQVFSSLTQALAGGHKSLVCYIADSISPGTGSGSVLVVMLEAAKLGNFAEALRLLNELPAIFLQPQCLNDIFGWGVIHKAVCAGHLEFYKTLHEKKHWLTAAPEHISSFLHYAISNGRESFALYILKTLRLEEKNREELIQNAQAKGLLEIVALLSSQISAQIVKPVLESSQRVLTPGFIALEVVDEVPKPVESDAPCGRKAVVYE